MTAKYLVSHDRRKRQPSEQFVEFVINFQGISETMDLSAPWIRIWGLQEVLSITRPLVALSRFERSHLIRHSDKKPYMALIRNVS